MSNLNDMVRSLKRVFPNGPSWPFRTASARTVWDAVDRILTKQPDLMAHQALQKAFAETKISSGEFTPEDYSILSMATRWKVLVMQGDEALKDRTLNQQQLARIGFALQGTPPPPAPYPGANPAKGK